VNDNYQGNPQNVIDHIRGKLNEWAQTLNPPATVTTFTLIVDVTLTESTTNEVHF